MNKIYSAELERNTKKNLRLYLLGSAMAVLIVVFLAALAVAAGGVTVPVTVALGLATALLGIAVAFLVMRRILPLYRADRLLKALQQKQAEPFAGVFRGLAEGKTMHSGVMMYKLRLDEGKRVGKEPVFRELSVPAVFGRPQIEAGTVLRGEAVESVVTGSELPPVRELKPTEGKYQVPSAAVLLILIASALLWFGIYGGVHRQAAETTLRVAVCAPAHHPETETALKQAMKPDGVDVVFSYTNTIEPEAVAMYLATFGAMDADILVFNGEQFAGVFENEADPLEVEELTSALGFEPRFVTNAAGQSTGVFLYIPDDPAYNAHFQKLLDWIAVEKDVALVAAIRYGSPHTGSGQANLALVKLLSYFFDQ